MDIGTAKPDQLSLKKIPHHLIDIYDPKQQFNLGDFIQAADKAVDEILERGNVPIISGGTAFYFKHFIFGLPSTPPTDEKIRTKILKEVETKGIKYFHTELLKIDPEYGSKIAPQDMTRVTRGIEVFRITGKPLSSFKLAEKPREDLDCLIIGLNRNRKELYQRINRRVDQMFEQGLLDEVKGLLLKGFNKFDPGFKGIGYREFFDLISNGCLTLGDIVDNIKQNSRRYAKRQITFFNSIPKVQWFHPDELGKIVTAINLFL
jgi:tRNA dimethylallyltransferase